MEIDLRILSKVALKIIGLFLVLQFAISIFPMLLSWETASPSVLVYFLGWGIVGAILFYFPGTVTNVMVQLTALPADADLFYSTAVRVGTSILGLYFVIAASGRVASGLYLHFLQQIPGQQNISPGLVGGLVELVLGFICLVWNGVAIAVSSWHSRSTSYLSDESETDANSAH